MGIFDFVKAGAREMFIARPETAKGLPIWKHPDPTIPMKAQLTVMADEVAFFYKDGTLVGQIGHLHRFVESFPAPEMALDEDSFVPPSGPVEEMVAQILARILGALRVGAHDNFFELGGHSLLATQVVNRIRRNFASSTSESSSGAPSAWSVPCAPARRTCSACAGSASASRTASQRIGGCWHDGRGEPSLRGVRPTSRRRDADADADPPSRRDADAAR